jgi:hypothetical protein
VRSQADRVSPLKRNEHPENNAGQEASKPLQKNKKNLKKCLTKGLASDIINV